MNNTMHTYRIDFETEDSKQGIIFETDLNEFGAAIYISEMYIIIGYISIKKIA